MPTRPRKANCCWRGLHTSPLCWRSWTHPTAGPCQVPGRGQAAAVGLIWQAKAPPWLEVVRLKAAVFPHCFPPLPEVLVWNKRRALVSDFCCFLCRIATGATNASTTEKFKSWSTESTFCFVPPPRHCLWQKTQLCCFLGFLRSPLREPTQFWIKFFNSHWNGLNQIPGSRFQIPGSNTA